MKTSPSTASAILIALSWRTLIAAATRTFFQPDEFFQSLEVAHRAVFGYGHLTWEWTVSPPIRSILFPALYVPVYWGLKVTGWDKGDALIIAPKVFQGAIAAIADISTRELARQILGEPYANPAFFLSLTSFFHILALGRTLSNSVETSLTTTALCFWPWHSTGDYKQLQLALAFAAMSCMVRPTSAVIWIFLFAELLWRLRTNIRSLKMLIAEPLATATFASAFLFLLDSWYFGKPTFTPLNFVLTNLSSVSLFYGQTPWHYYLSQGLPIMLNVCLPIFVLSAWIASKNGSRSQKTLLSLILWTLAVYSLLGHKEWRFIHPLLPLMYVISAKSLVDHARSFHDSHNAADQPKLRTKSSWSVQYAFLLLGILPGFYVMRLHGSAQVSVMSYIRTLDSSVLRSVGFLMPCHSTPWQAFLHRPELSEGRLWALGCEPPLDGQNLSTHRDQTEIFYASPLAYLKINFPRVVDPDFPPSPRPSVQPGAPPSLAGKWEHRWPSHLVFFGALTDNAEEGDMIARYLISLGYTEVWEGRNGFEEDRRRRGGVKVWRWQRR